MSMLRKAEVSIEFIAFLGILLLFFVLFVGVVGINSRDISESAVYTNAQNILDIVASEINTASRIEGYYREFYIPEKLSNGEDYSINCSLVGSLRIVRIDWDQGKNIMSNVATNVTGCATPGNNMIKNEDGEVKINAS